VVELDPSGGDIGARFNKSSQRGIISLILDQRQRPNLLAEIDRHCQCLPGGLEVLIGPPGGEAARTVDSQFVPVRDGILHVDADFIVDCGRLQTDAVGQRSVLESADDVVLVIDAEPAALLHCKWAIEHIRSSGFGNRPRLVVFGGSQRNALEMADSIDLSLLGILPDDPKAASIVKGEAGSTKHFTRSRLVHEVRKIVQTVIVEIPHVRSRSSEVAESHWPDIRTPKEDHLLAESPDSVAAIEPDPNLMGTSAYCIPEASGNPNEKGNSIKTVKRERHSAVPPTADEPSVNPDTVNETIRGTRSTIRPVLMPERERIMAHRQRTPVSAQRTPASDDE
jgi:hypothetical protein